MTLPTLSSAPFNVPNTDYTLITSVLITDFVCATDYIVCMCRYNHGSELDTITDYTGYNVFSS